MEWLPVPVVVSFKTTQIQVVTRNARKDLYLASQELVKEQIPLLRKAKEGKIAHFRHNKLIVKERNQLATTPDNKSAASVVGSSVVQLAGAPEDQNEAVRNTPEAQSGNKVQCGSSTHVDHRLEEGATASVEQP
ncbi:hypothetical protein E2C01_027810 [Portunus trituberculatus]|uniref:Uncharacterized protein n=1 Tax=Portunus trituberculatus TaxID=210409 RepID=A0A5B7EJ37_PORTR|nr:hypothetical protein [Portunus trituberculatus]